MRKCHCDLACSRRHVSWEIKLRSRANFGYALAGFVALVIAQASNAAGAITYPQVHVYQSGERGIFANAYLVETEKGVIAIDATLSNSDSKALRALLDGLHKPLLAVLLTHGHPDHYNGVTNLVRNAHVPVVATEGVAKVIHRDDAAKQAQWQPVFKEEWPMARTFPNTVAVDGGILQFDGVSFTVRDLGPGESDADSIWIVTAPSIKLAFVGDVVLEGVHAYLSDGHSQRWLHNIDRVRDLVSGARRLYPGHGESGGLELLDHQRDYLGMYRSTVASLANGATKLTDSQKNDLQARMLEYRQTERLQFLIKLGADPIAAELANGSSTR
jgi:glyoxylase-like metal-dependent hydrolase (beta-lactamase superfamily II)